VVATLEAIKSSGSNRNVVSFLEGVKISSSGTGSITLDAPTSNPLMVEALAYPILRSDVVDQIKNNRLKKESYITSGPFIFESSEEDTTYGFHRITLIKNPNYKKTVWLNHLSFKFFKDLSSLERGADTVTVIIPPAKQENIKTTGRFQAIEYSNYEFFGLFFHTDRIDLPLRKLLHGLIGNELDINPPQVVGHKRVNSIFLGEDKIRASQSGSITFAEYAEDKGLKKKWMLLADARNTPTTWEGEISYPKLQYFQNGGGNAVLYSDDPAADIRLTGKVPAATVSVKVNDYTLQEYTAGSTSFAYRISIEAGTIKTGKNTYTLSLTQRDGSVLSETLTIYQTTDADQMALYRQEAEATYRETENTPEKIAQREQEKSAKIQKIEALGDEWYYQSNLEPFSLTLAYSEGQEGIETYVSTIESSLRQSGILLVKKPLTAKELEDIITQGDKDYDMILVGVSAPGNIARLGRAFLSTDTKSGVNFSNIQSKNLDTLFEKLRTTTEVQEALDTQQQIVNFMNDMSFFLPISSPLHRIYIDRNIKGFEMIDVIPDITAFATILDTVSIKDRYEHADGKSIGGFFSWIGSHF